MGLPGLYEWNFKLMSNIKTPEKKSLDLNDVEFNRRYHEARPLRPIPPGRDNYAEQWRSSREFLFGMWIDIDAEIEPSDFTRKFDDMYWQADENIMPVVDLFERAGGHVIRPMFEKALTQGIDAVPDAPAELVEFFEYLTKKPTWFDQDSAERGRILLTTSTLSAVRASLGWGLYETAMTSDISSTTGATGRFQTQGVKRYIETLRMFAMAIKPDVFDTTSEEFQTMVRVRLMHALASRGLRKAWGEEYYLKNGEPIAATALLGFGNGPLLMRLVDHRFGRPLSKNDMNDLAMYSSWFGHVIGAPERLRSKDGIELVKSLNYVFARGGDPSGWREDFLKTIRQPFDAIFATYLPKLPESVRGIMTTLGCKTVSAIFIAPLVPVFGIDPVHKFVEGVDEFSLPYRFQGALFKGGARVNARMAAMRDRIPGIGALRRRIHRNGPPGIDLVLNWMSNFARYYQGIVLAYTHHDNSTAGRGFGSPRT